MGPISQSCGETDDTLSPTPFSLTQPPGVRLGVGDTFSHPGRGAGLQDPPPACSAGQHPATPSCFQGRPFSILDLLGFKYPHHPVYRASGLLQSPLGTGSLGGAPCCPQMGIRLPFTKATRDPGHPIGVRLRGLESESGRHLVGLASSGASKGQLDHLCIHLVPRGATAQASPR